MSKHHEQLLKQLSPEVFSRLEGLVAKEMEPIDPDDVAESLGIPPEEVEQDKKYVEETRAKIQRVDELHASIKGIKLELAGKKRDERMLDYKERLGMVFEGFLFKHIRESRIFKNVILHKTADYDDLRNGVDFVAEYEDPNNPSSYIALAMDASFSSQADIIGKKINRSINDIKDNRLSKVKYFQFHPESRENGQGVPRVVVGTDETHVKALLEKWDFNETSDKEKVGFEEDPVWTLMALQISEQLKVFIQEAEFYNKKDIAAICREYLLSLEKSLRLNKDLVVKHTSHMEKDGTSIIINELCKRNSRELVESRKMHRDNDQDRRDDEMYQNAIRKN